MVSTRIVIAVVVAPVSAKPISVGCRQVALHIGVSLVSRLAGIIEILVAVIVAAVAIIKAVPVIIITSAVNCPVWFRPVVIITVESNLWPVNIQRIVADTTSAGPAAVVDIVNIDWRIGISADIIRPRPGNIPAVVIAVNIIDDRSIADDIDISACRYVIWVRIWRTNILPRHKNPVIVRFIISRSESYININTRAKRCPSIIVAAGAPVHPSRPPLCSRDPFPTIIIRKPPSAVMKSCPSPLIIRYPSVAVLRFHPMSVGGIRSKIRACIRSPNVTQFRVVYPLPVRFQLIIKSLHGN